MRAREAISRIEAVMKLRCPSRVIKVKGATERRFPWEVIAFDETPSTIRIAFLVPTGYSTLDLKQETDAIYAACGAHIEIKDRGRAAVVIVGKADFPKVLHYTEVKREVPLVGRQILLGRDRSQRPLIHDLRVPHMLVCGMSGYGKTDFIRWLLLQLILRFKPRQFEFHVIDMKGFSFMPFVGVPHMTRPVARDRRAALATLEDAVRVMDQRSKRVWDARDRDLCETFTWRLIIVDEAARLAPMLVEDKEERKIAAKCWQLMCELSCIGREAGVGLIFCTQYPTHEVIRGQIKANMDAVLAFKALNGTHSLVPLDAPVAADLPDQRPGLAIIKRGLKTVQTPFVGNDKVWDTMLAPLGGGRGRIAYDATGHYADRSRPENIDDFGALSNRINGNRRAPVRGE